MKRGIQYAKDKKAEAKKDGKARYVESHVIRRRIAAK